jgi:hypothetical protein
MPKHDEALGGIEKNISVDSWCQCALIRRNGRIKSTGNHFLKNIPFVSVRASQRHTEK